VEDFRKLGIKRYWMAARDCQFRRGGGGVYVMPRCIVACSATNDNNFKVFYGITNITFAVCFQYSTA
jgi:hypothetical protein